MQIYTIPPHFSSALGIKKRPVVYYGGSTDKLSSICKKLESLTRIGNYEIEPNALFSATSFKGSSIDKFLSLTRLTPNEVWLTYNPGAERIENFHSNKTIKRCFASNWALQIRRSLGVRKCFGECLAKKAVPGDLLVPRAYTKPLLSILIAPHRRRCHEMGRQTE